MFTSKVYTILTYFDVYEQNRLRKYVNSPYFNKNDTLKELFELLLELANKYKGIDENKVEKEFLTKEQVWGLLKPNKPYDYTRFRKYCSDLLKLIEGFLAQNIYEKNPLHQATYLLEAIIQNKIEKLYSSAMKSARRLSNQQIFKPSSYYYYQFQIERNFYEIEQLEYNRKGRMNVEVVANNLDRFYLAEKLKYYCAVLVQQNFVSQDYEILFLDEIINHIKNYDYENIPPVAIYYHLYLTLIDRNDTNAYHQLIKLIDKYSDIFPKTEVKNIYIQALNFCVYNINSGKQEFLNNYFYVYNQILKNNVQGDEISPWDFKNIVVAALRLEKYAWTEEFITKYKHNLPEAFRESSVCYNMSQLYFYQKKYDDAISLLQHAEFDDIITNLNSKTMLLAIYYEKDEIEPLYSLFESFRVLLNRKKEIPSQKIMLYKNLIKFVKILTKTNPRDTKAIEKLKNAIDNSGGVASVKWLREKITELESSR